MLAISYNNYQSQKINFSSNYGNSLQKTNSPADEQKISASSTKWAIAAGLAVLATFGIVHVMRGKSFEKKLANAIYDSVTRELDNSKIKTDEIFNSLKKELKKEKKELKDIVFINSHSISKEFLTSKNLDSNCFAAIALDKNQDVLKSVIYKFKPENKPEEILKIFSKENDFYIYQG